MDIPGRTKDFPLSKRLIADLLVFEIDCEVFVYGKGSISVLCLAQRLNNMVHGIRCTKLESGASSFMSILLNRFLESGFMCVGSSRKAQQHAGRDPVQKNGIRCYQVCVGPTGLNRIPVQLNRIPVRAWVPSSEVVACVLSQADSHGIRCKKTEFGSARFV